MQRGATRLSHGNGDQIDAALAVLRREIEALSALVEADARAHKHLPATFSLEQLQTWLGAAEKSRPGSIESFAKDLGLVPSPLTEAQIREAVEPCEKCDGRGWLNCTDPQCCESGWDHACNAGRACDGCEGAKHDPVAAILEAQRAARFDLPDEETLGAFVGDASEYASDQRGAILRERIAAWRDEQEEEAQRKNQGAGGGVESDEPKGR